jgi:hypothetical protein
MTWRASFLWLGHKEALERRILEVRMNRNADDTRDIRQVTRDTADGFGGGGVQGARGGGGGGGGGGGSAVTRRRVPMTQPSARTGGSGEGARAGAGAGAAAFSLAAAERDQYSRVSAADALAGGRLNNALQITGGSAKAWNLHNHAKASQCPSLSLSVSLTGARAEAWCRCLCIHTEASLSCSLPPRLRRPSRFHPRVLCR